MTDQATENADPLASGRWTDPAVDAVCARFAPFWPLDAMVATNPYLGFVGQTFAATAEYHRRIIGRPMTMNRDWFREQLASGRITDADLEEALARSDSDMDLAALRARRTLTSDEAQLKVTSQNLTESRGLADSRDRPVRELHDDTSAGRYPYPHLRPCFRPGSGCRSGPLP